MELCIALVMVALAGAAPVSGMPLRISEAVLRVTSNLR